MLKNEHKEAKSVVVTTERAPATLMLAALSIKIIVLASSNQGSEKRKQKSWSRLFRELTVATVDGARVKQPQQTSNT